MIIGIDIRVLGNPVKSGIEEYAENLIPHLIKEDRNIDFKLFFSSSRNSLPDYEWLKASNVKLYKFKYPNNILFASSKFLNRPFIDKIIGGADVFFFPHFFISSLSPKCKRITTFHDLSFIHFPEHLTARKRIWHNLQMKPEWQAKQSDKIIAVSESTKKDLVNFYGIDPAKIKVVYSGINDIVSQLSTCDVLRISDAVNDFKKVKNLPDRFIFFLGKLEPRKNVVGVIKAFNSLKLDPKYKNVGLVIAGAKGWLCDNVFREANSQIIFTGQLTDEEKFLYYRAADVFVYPSFFEGFGFPPLEAMHCGTPVITSRNSSLPEVVGESAIMIDPHDTDELKSWIIKLLDDKKFSAQMVKKGIKQVSKFSWRDAAIKTLDVLTRA